MAVLCKLSRFSGARRFINQNPLVAYKTCNRAFRTVVQQQPKPKGILKISLIGASVGALVGIGYSLQKISRDRKNLALDGKEIEINVLKSKPSVPASRTVFTKTSEFLKKKIFTASLNHEQIICCRLFHRLTQRAWNWPCTSIRRVLFAVRLYIFVQCGIHIGNVSRLECFVNVEKTNLRCERSWITMEYLTTSWRLTRFSVAKSHGRSTKKCPYSLPKSTEDINLLTTVPW